MMTRKQDVLGHSVTKTLRFIAMILGILMILASVFADRLGLSAGSGFSVNQVAILVAGAVLVLAGVLGRRFLSIYKGAALLLLNVIVLLVIVEFLSLLAVKVIDSRRLARRADRLAEAGHENLERTVLISRYVPWVLWRSNPTDPQDPVYVDGNGYRRIPGSSDSPGAYRVFLFGGSTMWGAGVDDSCTIGAFLLSDLEELTGGPVSVSNMAQNAYTTTQEVIELVLQLRSGNVPDFVVFFDGFNDVWAAYESGMAGVHHSYFPIAERIEGRDVEEGIGESLTGLLRHSNTWLLVTSLRERGLLGGAAGGTLVQQTYEQLGADLDSLASGVAGIALQNYSLVEHLAEAYGFGCLFVWQPSLWYGGKVLTDGEEVFRNGGDRGKSLPGCDPAFGVLFVSAYDSFEESLTGEPIRYQSFADVFDATEEAVYTDVTGVHLTSGANGMIAGEILELMTEIDPDLVPAVSPASPD